MRAPAAFVLSALLAGAQSVTDRVPAGGGDIEITPFVHASVQLSHAGRVIHVDPWSRGDLSRARPADLILITDDVAHHLDVEAIRRLRKPGTPVVIPAVGKVKVPDGVVLSNGETGVFGGIHVEATAAYDLTPGEPYHPKGEANGYIVTLGGKRLFFAGVTECVPEIRALKSIDVAFLPLNLPVGRMSPTAAAACARALSPAIVYVNHYDQEYARAAAAPGAVAQSPGVHVMLKAFAAALNDSGIEFRQRDWYPPLR